MPAAPGNRRLVQYVLGTRGLEDFGGPLDAMFEHFLAVLTQRVVDFRGRVSHHCQLVPGLKSLDCAAPANLHIPPPFLSYGRTGCDKTHGAHVPMGSGRDASQRAPFEPAARPRIISKRVTAQEIPILVRLIKLLAAHQFHRDRRDHPWVRRTRRRSKHKGETLNCGQLARCDWRGRPEIARNVN